MPGLAKGQRGEDIQGFAPKKIVAVTSGAAWTPDENDIAFRIGTSCTYYINSASSVSGSILAGSITVINKRSVTSITFDTSMNIEVM